MPSMLPKTTVAAAMDAPVDPMLTNASAWPCLTWDAARKMDAMRFVRYASAGFSPSSTIPSEGSFRSLGSSVTPCFSNSALTMSGSPTTVTATLPVWTALMAAGTVTPGPKSPPIASSAMTGVEELMD